MTFSFKATVPIVGLCTFSGTNTAVTYSTGAMTNSFTFTNATLSASPSACGPAKLTADFFMTTSSNGVPIEIT